MSLINQMLRDLDSRQASALERSGVAAQVRALPPEKHFPWERVWSVIAGAVIGAVGLWLAFSAWQASPSPGQSVSPIAAAQPPAPAMAVTVPMLVVPMPSDVAAEPLVVETKKVPISESLQMDFRLSHLVPRAEPAAAAPTAGSPTIAAVTPTIDKRPLAPPPDTAEGQYRKGMTAYRQGRPSEAQEDFQSALRLDARQVSARQALLSLLMEQRQWQEAQAVATEGLVLVPGQPGWAMILARLQVEQGQIAEAEQTMATHARYGEHSADYLAFHGLLLEKLQRPQEAREAFIKAREIGSLPPDLAAAVEQRLR